jgi:hypothetical protein
MSPLLNYTTQVPAAKSVGEIEGMLSAHGARSINKEYDADHQISGLSFVIPRGESMLEFRVPVRPEAVLKVLQRQKMANSRMRRSFSRTQAVMIAWRIAKDWVEAQMALLETEMVELEQIFLPYLIGGDGRTLYEIMAGRGFLMLKQGDK